jgi:hypothetical protein
MSKDKSEKEIMKRLFLLEEDFNRDPEKAVSGREAFLAQAAAIREKGSIHTKARATSSSLPLRRRTKSLFSSIYASIMIAIAIVMATGIATVQASQRSQPDQFLYPVKIAAEDVALSMTADQVARFNLSADYVQNRASEIMGIFNEGKVPSSQVIARYNAQIQRAVGLAAGLEDEDAVEALGRLQNRLEVQEQSFELLNTEVSDDAMKARATILEVVHGQIDLSKEGQANLPHLRQLIDQKKLTATATIEPTKTKTSPGRGHATGTTGSTETESSCSDSTLSICPNTDTSGISATSTPTDNNGNAFGRTKTHTPPGQVNKTATKTPKPTKTPK